MITIICGLSYFKLKYVTFGWTVLFLTLFVQNQRWLRIIYSVYSHMVYREASLGALQDYNHMVLL